MPEQTKHADALDIDTINRETWKLPATIRVYERMKGWTDPGEQAAVEYVAAEVRSRSILDIGVGAGRTTTLLKAVSEDYIGIDYTHEMVQACRARHPGTRIVHMDARDLSGFDDGQFALVVFSFNGIDSVDYADRHKVLREVHRVLQPNGLFIVSAHNRLGPSRGETPRLRLHFSRNPLKLGWRMLQLIRSLVPSFLNHRRYRVLNETHDDWAIANCAAHNFGVVVMYTTLAEQKRQLTTAGFNVEVILDNVDGKPVTDDVNTRAASWFHYVARKV